MSNDIQWLPATELAHFVRTGELSAREIAHVMIEQVESINPEINAVIYWNPEQLLVDATQLDEIQAREGVLGALHGVPYTIKDLTAVRDIPLTLGVKKLRNNIPNVDAPIVERLRGSGGLFLGKTNTPEAGYCGKTDNHLFGVTRNPWNLEMSSGGSSGGAGAAVAAGLGPLAEGSDGGGSIRVPAAFNGIVGFKPSLGRIPSTMLSQRFVTNLFHGPLTRTVSDAALMMDVTSGEDQRDPLSLPNPDHSYLENLTGDITGWRIAFSADLGFGDVDPEVASIVATAMAGLSDAGALVEEATPDWPNPNEAMWNGVWVPGLAGFGVNFDVESMRGELDEELVELVAEGRRITASEVASAEITRGKIYDALTEFLGTYRIIASPTTMVATYPHTRFNPERLDGYPLRDRLLNWSLTHVYNMTTNPAISIPCGFTSDGRPVGLMLAGRLHADGDVLNAAAAFERARPWAHLRPRISSSAR